MSLLSDNDQKELKVYEVLKEVMDPEVGINIIDLGLVYKIVADPQGITIIMTLSSPGCPMGDIIVEDIGKALERACPGENFEIELTWEPRWSADLITPEGRRLLGLEHS